MRSSGSGDERVGRLDVLTRGELAKIRDDDLDHEATARLEVSGRVAEAVDLFVLGRQVHDRVEHEKDEAEGPVDPSVREGADPHVDRVGAWFRLELFDHRSRQVDPVHFEASLTQRHCNTTGADPELENGPRRVRTSRLSWRGSTPPHGGGPLAEQRVVMRTPWDGAAYGVIGDSTDASVVRKISSHHGLYEPDVMIHIQRTVREGWTAIDVGANVGAITIILSKLTGSGRVVAFEPGAVNFDYLVRNIADNELSNVTPVRAAVGAANGTAQLVYDPAFAGGAYIGTSPRTATETTGVVDVVSLDSWLATQDLAKVDFIKIDVEGFELEALRGAERVIREHQPDLVIEYNPVAHQLHDQPIDGMWPTLRRLYRWTFWIREDGTCAVVTGKRHLRKLLVRKGSLDLYCTARLRPELAGTKFVMLGRAARERWHLIRDYNRFRLPIRNFVMSPGVSVNATEGPIVERDGALRVTVDVSNESRVWLSSSFEHHPVNLGVRWLDQDGSVVEESDERTRLPRPIRPGSRAFVHVRANPPKAAGRVRGMQVALVQESFAWLHELDPKLAVTLPVAFPSESV